MSRPGGAVRASKGRSERERRALNVVWTAAGEYGFVPEVLSFYRDGEPDIYMNLVVGLAHRYYDAGQLRSYMRELDESLLRSVFIDILWQGIENAVYERELPVRPVLRELAQEHARRRLSDELDMSMQQRMLRSDIVHTLEAGRAHELLGEPTGILNPWDRRLYAALRYPGDIDTEGIIARTREVLRRFFVLRFRDVLRRRGYHISLGTWMNAWLRRLLPLRVQFEGDIEHIERPVLEEGGAVPGGGPEGLSWGRSAARTQRELDRLAEEYGPPLLPEGEIAIATYRDGTTKTLVESDATECNLPMTVIVNGNTASAAELFTASLRDFGKASVVGTQTFGKGIMQVTQSMPSGGALTLTVATYQTTKGECYHKVGIKPDEIVEVGEDAVDYSDPNPEKDPQLKKAIEMVQAK